MENEFADILERIRLIRNEVSHSDVGIPQFVIELLDGLISDFSNEEPCPADIVSKARGITLWYFDQGFKSVPIHSKLADLGTDLERLFRNRVVSPE
jgi:hypothetical protein